MVNKKLIIIRGVSGAGKSTYIKKHLPNAVVCSADHYFQRGGKYNFDPTKLCQAHGSCKLNAEKYLKAGEPLVVIDNTNTQLREMKPYVQLARKYGYDVEFVRLETPVDVAASRNVHGVPKHTVERMASRMADIPSSWGPETIILGV